MSKMHGFDKRRFNSFLLYILIAIWFMSGCAAKSSVEMNEAKVDSQSVKKDVNVTHAPAEKAVEAVKPAEDKTSDAAALEKDHEPEYTESEPRIFVKPSGSKLGQVLGIDFSMLPQGKSRLTVTTNKKVNYDLDRVDRNRLSLNIHDSQIGELLLKDIDTTQFQTALEKVQPVFDKKNKEVKLGITMREVVPFHVKQSDSGIVIDFGKITTKIAEEKIVPLSLKESETKNLQAAYEPKTVQQAEIQAFSPAAKKKYTGQPLYLDFVNADVTNILKLINAVSKENIIWDPAIKGKKVSMILHDVPWDEALDLILKNNDLAERYVGENIVWITTKQKMAQILAEEESASKKMEQKLEDERLKIEEQAKRVEDNAPLVTEYLPVDFAKADTIEKHIVISKRGNISVDPRTNTIIIKDTAASIEEAKKIVKRFDTPVKQIMLEARIVEAQDSFSRNLGIKWNTATSGWRTSQDGVQAVTLPPDASATGGGFTPGQKVYGGTFSTNAPEGWESNIGLNFAKLTSNGLGSITLDASIALAESDGLAKTLSAPKIIAQEGEESTIKSGTTIYTNPTENVGQQSRDATLQLRVKPVSISYNGYVTLDMTVTDNQNVSATLDSVKEVNTILTIKSGETIVVGGIIKENNSNNVSGVPILKDIPGLGWLFKSKTNERSKSELLIFLTPTVLPPPVKEF